VAGIGICAAGAIAAEGALHPHRDQIAEMCPCMANETCEDVEVTAADGVKLSAWHYTPKGETKGTIIVLHGIGGSRNQMVHISSMFLKNGYATLIPDNRGHGRSGGLVTYGVLEEGDVHAWASWLLEKKKVAALYGFGASLGASVLLESLNQETRFRAVVAESAYSDFPAIGRERMARQAPGWLQWTAPMVVGSGLAWTGWKYGPDLGKASAMDAVRRTKTPVFLIHGREDRSTEPENSVRLAKANPAVTQLWIVPGSHHADAWSTTGREFEDKVLRFYASH
jgi:pimeloyl-ACP methyl ester carboxylesterase